jgi:hypothetical protein
MVHPPPRSFNYRWGTAVLLISLLIASAWYSYYVVDNAREEYQASSVETATPETDAAAAKEADKNAAAEILKQAEQFRGWSVIVLGAIVAILVTTKVHRTPRVELAYLPLGPATIFLVNSLHASWVLSKRYTYLVATNDYSDYGSISRLLQVESDLFLYSIVCVSLFAGWFLFLIVFGKIEPFEAEE